MVVAVFPLAKIGLLLLKQLSKPVANVIKNEAKKHPVARKYVIVPIGRAYSWVENRAVSSVTGGKVEQVTEDEAVELGANAMGEIVLFSILCIILIAEMSRQGDKKAVKEKTKAEELVNLQDLVLELNHEVSRLKKDIEDIQYVIENPPDIFDLETQRHVQLTDHNFWDQMTAKQEGSKGKKSFRPDKRSPSF